MTNVLRSSVLRLKLLTGTVGTGCLGTGFRLPSTLNSSNESIWQSFD
jgi:hypothetical protein